MQVREADLTLRAVRDIKGAAGRDGLFKLCSQQRPKYTVQRGKSVGMRTSAEIGEAYSTAEGLEVSRGPGLGTASAAWWLETHPGAAPWPLFVDLAFPPLLYAYLPVSTRAPCRP